MVRPMSAEPKETTTSIRMSGAQKSALEERAKVLAPYSDSMKRLLMSTRTMSRWWPTVEPPGRPRPTGSRPPKGARAVPPTRN